MYIDSHIYIAFIPTNKQKLYHFLPALAFLRVMMTIILRSKDFPVYHFGLTCGSWVVASRGSPLRTFLAPMGSPSSKSAVLGNVMVARLGPPVLAQIDWGIFKNHKNDLCKSIFLTSEFEISSLGAVFENLTLGSLGTGPNPYYICICICIYIYRLFQFKPVMVFVISTKI